MRFLTSSIMSTDLITISENKSIAEAEKLMMSHRIRHLPVVDIFNELSGIISATDVARYQDKKNTVKSIMNSRVRIIKDEANIKKAIDQMLKFKISSMLVSHHEELVGIVTTDDLLQLLYELIDEDENLIRLDVASFLDDEWDEGEDEEEQLREVTLNMER